MSPSDPSAPLVWLPFEPERLGSAPAGLRYEVFVDGGDAPVPDSVAEVEFYVPSYELIRDQKRLLASMPRLRVVQTLTAGVDHIRAGVPEGVQLCNGRGIHNASTAELAVTLVLASLRGIPELVHAQDEGRWHQGQQGQQGHQSLADKTVLIVGYGDIGADLERRLVPFEVEVLRVARTAREGVHATDELPALLPRADVVVLVVPATRETRGMVDAGFLDRMREGALLVNVARGPVVDTDALLERLRAGRIRAALDVTDPEPLPADHPLWHAPGVLITPHVGGATPAMWPRSYRLVAEQLERFAAGAPLANVMTGDY